MMVSLLLASTLAVGPVDLVVAGLDRRFEGEVGATEWTEAGVTATVSLPQVSVDLHRHRLTLSPRAEAPRCCFARAELELSGRGLARVEVAGTPIALDDEVEAPRQVLVFEGQVAVEIEETGAVSLVLVQGPSTVSAAVRSRLAGQLGMMCALALGPAPCAALTQRLNRVETAGPSPGTRLDLPAGVVDPVTLERLRALASH